VALITPGDLQYAFSPIPDGIRRRLSQDGDPHDGRHKLIGMIGGFHGKSMAPWEHLESRLREPFLPLMNWSHVPFGNVDALKTMMESCDFSGDRVPPRDRAHPGEGGIVVAPPGYLAAARELCDKYGAMLVFDEIQSAWAAPARCSPASTTESRPT